jgi:NitT/TauT family transport system substrate-binding protein
VAAVAVAALLAATGTACGSDDDGGTGADGSCGTVSVAFPTSTESKAVTYAASEGLVESDRGTQLDVSFLEVPALIQATGTDQYDLLQTSLLAFAGAVDKGAPLVGVAPVASRGPGQDKLVVAADSPITSLEDLQGRTVAVGSIGSTVTTLMRMGLAKATGLDAAAQGGDMKFVEMPAGTALTGIDRGSVDAAFIYQQPWWGIADDPKYRELTDVQTMFVDAYGFRPYISMLITTKSIVSKKENCLQDAAELLASSSTYAKEHSAEVAEALSPTENVDAEHLEALIKDGYEYGGTQDDAVMDAAKRTLTEAHDAGELTVPVPTLADYMLKG